MRRAAGLLALFAALAVLHTWPLASDPAGLSRLDNDDAGLNTFVIAWVAGIVGRDPLRLFHAPIFFPERYTLAYSEHLLVPSLIGAPLIWTGVAPVTVYNLLVLAGFALSGWTMALVMSRWTGSTLAGVIAGMLYAFNAHLLTRLAHLQAIHMQFFPVALLGLDQLLRSAPKTTRSGRSASSVLRLDPNVSSAQSAQSAAALQSTQSVLQSAALLTSAFILQALCSNYTLVFLSAALLICVLVRADEWLGPGRRHRLVALLVAGLTAAIALAPFLWPYYAVNREQGLSRSIDEVALYSASWADYLATGGRLHYAWWSHAWFEGRTALFPGVTGLALAGAALGFADLRRDPRVRMTLAFGLAGVALSFGPALPGYTWLHQHVPILTGLRAAARWGVLFLAAVAVLAGFAVAWMERRWRGWTYWPAAALVLVGLVSLEALRAPLAFVGVPSIPALYDDLARESDAVVVELPLFFGPSVSENARYLLHSTRHFRPMVNGYSGFETAAFRERAARWRGFPDPQILADMAAVGVTHVVIDTRELAPSQVAAAANSAALVLIVEEAGRRLYRLWP